MALTLFQHPKGESTLGPQTDRTCSVRHKNLLQADQKLVFIRSYVSTTIVVHTNFHAPTLPLWSMALNPFSYPKFRSAPGPETDCTYSSRHRNLLLADQKLVFIMLYANTTIVVRTNFHAPTPPLWIMALNSFWYPKCRSAPSPVGKALTSEQQSIHTNIFLLSIWDLGGVLAPPN